MAKTAALALRINPQLKAELEAAARADGRSLTSYVEQVLLHRATGAAARTRLALPDDARFEIVESGVVVWSGSGAGWLYRPDNPDFPIVREAAQRYLAAVKPH